MIEAAVIVLVFVAIGIFGICCIIAGKIEASKFNELLEKLRYTLSDDINDWQIKYHHSLNEYVLYHRSRILITKRGLIYYPNEAEDYLFPEGRQKTKEIRRLYWDIVHEKMIKRIETCKC